MSAKQGLRKEILARMAAMDAASISRQSASICGPLLAWEPYRRAQHVAVFLPMAREVDVMPVLRDLWARGARCYVPVCPPGKGTLMRMVALSGPDDLASFRLAKYGVLEPPAESLPDRANAVATRNLDLVVVPGLGFAPDGRRLGRGGGYYDRFLAHCRSELPAMPVLAAVAFVEQRCAEIPMTSTDFPVDAIFFGDGQLSIASSGSNKHTQ